jgi:hypothetical protein
MRSSDSPQPDVEFIETLRLQMSLGAPAGSRARVERRLGLSLGVATARVGSRIQEVAGTSPAGRPRTTFDAIVSRPIRLAFSSLVVGGAMGAGLYAHFAPRAERIVYVDRIVEITSAAPLVAPTASTPMTNASSFDAPRSAPSNTAAVSADGGRSAERALLDRARHDFGAGDYAEVERELDRHARRFPSGVLREEREALASKVLVATGRHADARRRAAQFRERFPTSLFGSAVDDALQSIP